MNRNVALVYLSASLASLLLSNWALLQSHGYFNLWIALGPIGLIGFATFSAASWLTPAVIVLYYVLATLALAVCLHFARGTTGIRRYLAVAAMVLVWLICAYHNLYVLSWAA